MWAVEGATSPLKILPFQEIPKKKKKERGKNQLISSERRVHPDLVRRVPDPGKSSLPHKPHLLAILRRPPRIFIPIFFQRPSLLHCQRNSPKSHLSISSSLDLQNLESSAAASPESPPPNPELVEILLRHFTRRDIERVDHFGKTALHYAAALGHRTNLVALVSANPTLVYVADNDGNFPLHIIVKDGRQFPMVKDILSSNACAAEILNRKGRNVLHVAVMNGNLPMLKFLLELPELTVLINEPDSDGNTPLHLAVKIHFLRMVSVLLRNGASVRITNKQGLTPLDVNDHFDEGFLFKQLLIRRRLKRFGAVFSPLAWVKKMGLGWRRITYLSSSELRSLANTMSVVAALIATVTFAAAFAFPGGYKNNEPGEGRPVFIRRAALKAFVLSDTVAFSSSLTVAFLMVYTLAGNQAFLVTALLVSILLLWLAVSGTVVALASALYVVLSDESLWLAIAAICVGCSVPLLVYGAFWFSELYTLSPFKKLRDEM